MFSDSSLLTAMSEKDRRRGSRKDKPRTPGKDALRAPTNWKFERATNRGGSASFEAYFLRDLYQKGEIDDRLIEEIVEQNQMSVSVDDVVGALKDPSGDSIPSVMADHLANIAHVVVDAN